MFSAKILIAIEVLLNLGWTDRDIHRRGIIPGTDISEVLDRWQCHRTTCRAVLSRLMQSGYIVFTGMRNCYTALRDPELITVMHLVQLFHGDICIGEIYDHRLVSGPAKPRSATGRNLMDYENSLRDRLRDRFRTTPITAFRNDDLAPDRGAAQMNE